MNAQELVQKLERIISEYGPGIWVEARNVAGDFDYIASDYESAYGTDRSSVNVRFNGEKTVVRIEP